jgi:uncharacterized protein (DUF1697 family)
LKALCAGLGFTRIETYIASGNVVFDCALTAPSVEARLEKQLLAHAGKPLGVFVRSATEMRSILDDNPFPDRDPRLTYTFFLAEKPDAATLADVRGRDAELLHLGKREMYVHYPDGMGQSKLRIPAAALGTARNMNTVAKLVELGKRVDLCTRK